MKKAEKRVLIYGAGSCGRMLIEQMKNAKKFSPVAIIDDDTSKTGKYIVDVPIVGKIEDIKKICNELNIDTLVIAIPSMNSIRKKQIINLCYDLDISVKIIPPIYRFLDEVNLDSMKDVELRDLLGREEVSLDKKGIKEYIEGKVILVTGGGGSIGSELCRQITTFNPSKLLILDIYENNAYDLQNELKRKYPLLDQEILIASVRDRRRMENIFDEYRPSVVFHAAAHKHVPLMEANPSEAIKNNVMGTLNTVECADKYEVEKFVLISTDKAVNPTNVMGATKRICEMIVQAMEKQSATEFTAVRFGNVLGSNGSVIPLFKKQIEEGGPVTVTHKDITRYFMLIPEATQLVLQAGAYANGGEIFVLDMGKPVKVYELAENLIRLSGLEPMIDIDIEVVGLRPGEKLYEELLMSEEGLENTPHEKIFIGRPGEFDISNIRRDVKELYRLSEIMNHQDIREKIKKIVPTYITEKENRRKRCSKKAL